MYNIKLLFIMFIASLYNYNLKKLAKLIDWLEITSVIKIAKTEFGGLTNGTRKSENKNNTI